MRHSFVTLVMPFASRHEQAVLERLRRFHHQPAGAVAFELAPAIADEIHAVGTIHFMSINVLPADAAVAGTRRRPATLLVEMTVDGSATQAIHALCARLGDPLRALLGDAGLPVSEPLAAFLLRHHCAVGEGFFDTTGLNFDGSPEMTVERIRSEAELAAWIEPLLRLPRQGTALETLNALRDKLWQETPATWAKWVFEAKPVPVEPVTRSLPVLVFNSIPSAITTLGWPLLIPPAAAVGVAIAFPWTGVIVLPAAVAFDVWLVFRLYQKLRLLEQSDQPDDTDPDVKLLERVLQREDRATQNHLYIRSKMKPGWLRRLALKAMFFGIRSTATYAFKPGHLSDIGSIHFARWILLPGSDDLIFFSNYSGSWESYLEDFIQRATNGLTGVWSNTEGFPKTANLVDGGAADGARFKRWARRQQFPTAFWYSAYPTLSNERIRKNAQIRAGFACARDERGASAWLAHFGGPTPPPIEPNQRSITDGVSVSLLDPQPAPPRPTTPALEPADITTLIFSGLGKLADSLIVFYRFEGPLDQRKQWLMHVAGFATYGDGRAAKEALVIGLTAQGLKELGLSEEELASFPVAFQHGSALRARAIGDVQDEAAEHWKWGGEHSAVHVVLSFYAPKPKAGEFSALPNFVKRVVVGKAGVREVQRMQAELSADRTEPFGFADGISQPFVRGTRADRPNANKDQCIEPGEMLLGYPDGLGILPPSPSVADSDAAKTLPLRGDGRRDLGCNGTFLVIRQLEQNVRELNALLQRAGDVAAAAKAVPDGVAAADWVAAKMIGRWKNGSTLVRHPDRPGEKRPDRDESFRFGAEDPDGLRCPFGSHVRRTNPRESFEPGSEARQAVTNRHRLLRVGRRYRSEQGAEGMMFMCLNADLERQFEFVQQTWVRGQSFHGLRCEVDPIFTAPVAAGDTVLTIPTVDGPLRVTGPSPRLITLRGSGYFFVPGKRALQYLATR